MKPEIKKLWTDALESGQYSQGQCYLRKDDRYCCLGVLSELAFAAGICDRTLGYDDGAYRYDGHDGILPASVLKWSGLARSVPDVVVDGKLLALSTLNDKMVPFETIAEYIKDQL